MKIKKRLLPAELITEIVNSISFNVKWGSIRISKFFDLFLLKSQKDWIGFLKGKRALVVKVLNNVKNNINNIDLEPRTVDYAKYIEAFDDVYEYFNMAKKRNHQFDEFFTGVEWPAAPGELTKYLYSTRKRTALLKMISNVVGFVDTCVDVDMLDCLYQLSNGIGCVVSLTIGIGVVGAGSSCGAK